MTLKHYHQIQGVRILLAAGVFFPDVGGPAVHVKKIAERLTSEGALVTVLAYGDDHSGTTFAYPVIRVSRSHTKLLQWVLYGLMSLHHAKKAEVIYAFDPTAAGLPARLSAALFRKPFLIRVGGDPIWERLAETGKTDLPMVEYYSKGYWKKDHFFIFKIISFVLKGAQTLVLYNEQFAHFYTTYFGVCREKIVIIKNPAFKRESAAEESLPDEPTLLFAGRFVKYKNLERVIRAFSRVRRTTGKGKLVLIGKGPEESRLKEVAKECSSAETIIFSNQVPQEKLFESIRSSTICLGPALSEFNPNFVLECLSFGKPVLLSRGHGLSVDLPDEFLFNPTDQEELEINIKSLLSAKTYDQALKKIASIPMNHTWEDIGDAHIQAISKALKSVSHRKATG